MLTYRIIPCLDVSDGRVVKGVNFVNLKDAGEPVECAKAYDKAGADELCFLDINASYQNKSIMLDKIRQTACECFMPLTVGGGVRNLEDIRNLLKNGADKVAINTKAVQNPQLVQKAAEKFGSQCISVAIDAKKNPLMKSGFEIFTHGGRRNTHLDALEFAQNIEKKGAGEIILTSIDQDGTKKGFQLQLTKTIADNINIPVIASGGGGELKHFEEAIKIGGANAVLAASVFHFGEISIKKLKKYLLKQNINVRDNYE